MIPSDRVRALMFQFRANLKWFFSFLTSWFVRYRYHSVLSLSISLRFFSRLTVWLCVCVCGAWGGRRKKKEMSHQSKSRQTQWMATTIKPTRIFLVTKRVLHTRKQPLFPFLKKRKIFWHFLFEFLTIR